MREILFQMDGKDVKAAEGTSVLSAARSAGIHIPTLCHDDRLEPYGACRLCTVELEARGGKRFVAACLYPVEQGLVVRTRSERIDRIRKLILELLLAHAPCSPQLEDLSREYGADRDRFEKEAQFCIHCGLCVRYCAEVKKKNAVGFVERGITKAIGFVPEVASVECNGCKECFPLCPTSYLQAAFVLTEALAFPPDPKG